ncbi:RNB domain-containing ribonuclease [Streptomyces sp. BH-SS-21]|uniref:RNB domain-containing ribonuclease n=1 Tax=Streptomyces liliiviolaceus TaxID=2823109 RepID=A0A941B6J5_9ACTN|nr:RNB domain-containing ribonuclease [Streptomyces liliiviolaceus]MBQ0849416.1 RNB domain-containing ribonuclease [Streptomyces liliiviolaceus]
MPRRRIRATGAAEAPLRAALRALRAELDVPEDFPPDVLAEAERAAREPRPPERGATVGATFDATDIPLFTIDPPTSTDLDQAMHLSRRAHGYRVRYAIADVAAFVVPGAALDAEAHRRVTTLYFPDERTPLHPPVLSEGAASLLPDGTRPAVLWTIDLDADGSPTATDVRRALVRSRAKLDYAGVQRQIDAGTAEEPLALLRDIGLLREQREVDRGGISLDVPEQEIIERTAPGGRGDDTYELVYRAPLSAEGWNAQISLLTGMAAAELMLTHGTGILRTLPAAPDGAVGRLRRTAHALRIDWPHHVSYARLIRSLDPHRPHHAAFLQECTTLLRGAGYTPFRDGVVPDITTHAAVAAPYTHCTAPLRRLVDRYASELSLAAAAGAAPPEWVLAALDELPARMAEGTRRAGQAERGCVDIVEAALLKDRVGELFDGTVVDVQEREPGVGTVQLETPAVVARIESGNGTALPLGERLRVRLTRADPGTAKVLFAPA